MAGVASAAIVSGELVLGLSDGSLLRCGYVQGPQGLKGDRGPQGSTGQPGKDGNTLLHGVGTPQFSDGIDGDFFYSTDQVAIYGPRTGGQWGKPVYLRPQDNKSFTLPTGMKSQGSASAGRAFAASMGGPGGSVVVAGSGGAGSLKTIEDHGLPLPAGAPILDPATGAVTTPATWKTIAIDTDGGDAMIVDVFAETATGSILVEVAAMRDQKARTGYSEVYEVRTGTPPILNFRTSTSGTGEMTLQVYSNVALDTLRGRVLYI